MVASLKHKLEEILREKHLSAIELEKLAGLNAYAVRNILLGRSQKPNVHTVKAIADVLGCSIEELLEETQINSPSKSSSEKKESTSPTPIENPDLFVEATRIVMNLAKEKKQFLTIAQAFKVIQGVYAFTLKKNFSEPDQDFAEWLLEQN